MKKKKRTKRGTTHKGILLIAALVSLLVISSLIYYTTISLLKDHKHKRNDFAFADLSAEVVENDGKGFVAPEKLETDQPITKKVQIKNTGGQPIFVRVMLFPTFTKVEDDDLTLSLPATFEGDKPILSFQPNEQQNWLFGEDGYFYYLKKIEVGKLSDSVIETVVIHKENFPEDLADEYAEANLAVEVKVEAIGLTQWAYRDAFWQGEIPESGGLKTVDTSLEKLTEKGINDTDVKK